MDLDRAVPVDLDGEHGDLAPFAVLDDLAAAARVAYLVEMDHFVHEKYEFRLLLIRYLASRGWRWFGEELEPYEGDRLDRYLRTGDESLLAPEDQPPWYTRGVLAGTTDRHPAAEMAAEQARFARSLRRTVPDARWFGFDIGRDDADYLALANDADSYEALNPAMALRERRIHERVGRVLDDHPGEKVALMAGSLHLMKDDGLVDAPGGVGPGGDAEPSVGHHVAHRPDVGPVLAIWLLHGEGTSANPWLAPPGWLHPGPRTVDADLLGRLDRPHLLRVDRDRHRRRFTQMHNLVLACRPADQVDAIVFAPRVTPFAVDPETDHGVGADRSAAT